MADTKITGYAELTTPATGDQIEVVDVSDTSLAASGTNKRMALGTLKATGAEVDTGTNDVKFVTPKAIADSSIGSASIVSKTVAEMQALVGSFVPGQLYLITDANKTDLGALIRAATVDSLESAGSGGFLNADFQKVGDYSDVVGFAANQGVWTAAIDATVVDSDVVIWNCLQYLVADASSVDGTDPATNAVAYTLLTKAVGHGYIEEWDAVLYDLVNNLLTSRADRRSNLIASNDGMDQFQWGSDLVFRNNVGTGFLACVNNTGTIAKNTCGNDSTIAAENNAGSVQFNLVANTGTLSASGNAGDIESNVVTSDSVLTANLNSGTIEYNLLLRGLLQANSNSGILLGNTIIDRGTLTVTTNAGNVKNNTVQQNHILVASLIADDTLENRSYPAIVALTAQEAAPAAPTAANGAGGTNLLNAGNYKWRLVYNTAEGHTEAGAASNQITVDPATEDPPTVTLPAGASLFVSSCDVYRTEADGTVYKLVEPSVSLGSFPYPDNVPDASLGAIAPTANTTANREVVATPGQVDLNVPVVNINGSPAVSMAAITIENAEAASSITPVADGTYTVGIGVTVNGTITVAKGIVTAIQEAS